MGHGSYLLESSFRYQLQSLRCSCPRLAVVVVVIVIRLWGGYGGWALWLKVLDFSEGRRGRRERGSGGGRSFDGDWLDYFSAGV